MKTNQTRREFIRKTGAGAAALGATAAGWPSFEARAEGEKRRPNILFFFPDQHRYDWIGSNPAVPVRTPHLDALGERGVRFEQAVCPSPLCAPSRACLAAGVEYDRCGVPSNQVDFSFDAPTFYRLLRDSGYHVLGCGKFDLNKLTKIRGADGKLLIHRWGFSDGIDSAGKWDATRRGVEDPQEPYMAYLVSKGLGQVHLDDMNSRRGEPNRSYTATHPTPLPEEAYTDNFVAANGLHLLAESPKDRPWFLQVNFPGPHAPMDITSRMEKSVRGRSHPQPNRNTQHPPETHHLIRQNYSAMVENIDRWLGIYIEALRERGEFENTVIVYSSDHGEMLGDHDLWGKSKPHQPSVGVPLSIAGPGVARTGATQTLATILDLSATFLDWAGLEVPAEMDSRSLAPFLAGESSDGRSVLHSALLEWRMARDERYKLIEGWPNEESVLLFDLQEDPLENVDLSKEMPGKVKELRDTFRRV